uniref:Uncharacterized protein n=1 Tax=Acrobeloides nanus TaxID=290746 RepID=A0A914DGF4_9BILA
MMLEFGDATVASIDQKSRRLVS